MTMLGLHVILLLSDKMSDDVGVGPAIRAMDAAECLVHCYRNASCSAVFFNSVDQRCFPSLKVYETGTTLADFPGVLHYGITSQTCPREKGYTFVRGAGLCIKLSTEFITPDEASALCQNDNGTLVRPMNAVQLSALFSSYLDCVSIDGHRVLATQDYRWSTGEDIAYIPWKDGYPKTQTHFVRLAACQDGIKNINPSNTLGYICQLPNNHQECPP